MLHSPLDFACVPEPPPVSHQTEACAPSVKTREIGAFIMVLL